MCASPNLAVLLLAHSPDPDDAFMWWPITGKVIPPEDPGKVNQTAEVLEGPVLDTGRYRFRAIPADIEALNQRALRGDGVEEAPLDITALSVRTWADVASAYAITKCGASFGDGYGPKLVARATDPSILCERCLDKSGIVIAMPGRGTTGYMVLRLLLRDLFGRGEQMENATFVEMRFDQVMPAVAHGRADVGLVIHEGQLTSGDTGLCTIADLGAWWKQRTGLKLPLGVNAIRRDLDARFGPGTTSEVSGLLDRSVAHAMEHWDESVRYALTFAEANASRSRSPEAGRAGEATLERVDRYCQMYVTEETRDMGTSGREAIMKLLQEGAAAGLCPAVGVVELA